MIGPSSIIAAEPLIAEPLLAESSSAQPLLAEPSSAQPLFAELSAQPLLTEPSSAQPVLAELRSAEPIGEAQRIAEEPEPTPAVPSGAGRLVQEVRPVLYENFVLFLGAFLVFAGSVYFAIYFWERLGVFGPLVAGSLLAIYASGFAGMGYLLQRRYRAELSSRVLFGVATAIYPVAATLAGEPLRHGGGVAALAGGAVLVWTAAAYPAISVAAALFQREIARPFSRAFAAMLLAIGLAPLVLRVCPRPVGVLYLYLCALPLLAMYRRVREVGRVFEPDTVLYVVGGSAYLLLAVAVRTALLLAPSLTLPEVAPLAVLLATAAIDLDVEWRVRSRAVRKALGVVGVLAHAVAVVAVVLAFPQPAWRVLTTLGAGALFAVTALRHRRPRALHLALAALTAGLALVAWLPALGGPRLVAMSGGLLLPWALGLARLGARWRRNAAAEFAAPVERWVVLAAALAALATAATKLGADWQLIASVEGAQRTMRLHLGTHLPALLVLPATVATLLTAWRWGRRPPYLTFATLILSAGALMLGHLAGVPDEWMPALVGALALGAALAALRGEEQGQVRPALQHAAIALLGGALVAVVLAMPAPAPETYARTAAVAVALVAAAGLALAAGRPGRVFGVVAMLALGAALSMALWFAMPRGAMLGALTLALLALDRAAGGRQLGLARPFRDAYPLALALLGIQVLAMFGNAQHHAPPPIEPALSAAAFLWIAARHKSPWPSYAAFGFLMGSAYLLPAALGLPLRPTSSVKLAALALVALSLGLSQASRWAPPLRRWRAVFFEVPLHLAAVAAPLLLWRAAETFQAHGLSGEPLLLFRRVAAPLALALLAAFTHGSRLHAYLAALTAVVAAPVVASALGWRGDPAMIAPLVAAMAVALWLGALAMARSERCAAPLPEPLPLFGLWRLPTAATWRALWHTPLTEGSALAALAAAALTLGRTADRWPAARQPTAVAYALLAGYAALRWWHPAALAATRRFTAHAACAALALAGGELLHLLGGAWSAPVMIAAAVAFFALAEGFAIFAPAAPRAAAGRDAAAEWAIGLPLLALVLDPQPVAFTAPLAACALAVAVLRYRQRHAALPLGGAAASLTLMLAAGYVLLWPLARAGWVDPEAVAFAALALLAAGGGWAHHLARPHLALPAGAPLAYASRWSLFACALATLSAAAGSPAAAPPWLAAALAMLALAAACAWFLHAALRGGRDRHGFAAWLALALLYLRARTAGLGAGAGASLDPIVLVAFAFALHLAAELLRRKRLGTLERPAAVSALLAPLAAAAVVLWDAFAGDGSLTSLRHALLAETIGVLYTLAFRSGGPRWLGLAAGTFYNLGLAILWVHTDRRDPLFYAIPAGISIVALASVYRQNLGEAARRGLHVTGCLLVYFATYFRVVQFDSGLYPLLLGGLTLVGLALGFALQLRDLFLMSAGFLVLDVISNLAYYGVHRPLLGWTLLTAAGLGLTAAGVLFQLRRAELTALVSRVRAQLRSWQ